MDIWKFSRKVLKMLEILFNKNDKDTSFIMNLIFFEAISYTANENIPDTTPFLTFRYYF
jgi:hypothetical protein